MANSADVLVRFLADTSQVDKGVSGMGASMKQFGRSVATFVGGAAIGAFAKDSIDAANDMAESVNKMKVVFGQTSGEISRFTRNAAEDFGLSRQAATDAAGTYGNLFSQLGLAPRAVADMSKGLLTLSADLASFHNADPTDVIEAQTAAFRGEYDSLQRFIPTINAATVETRALADTGKTNAKELTAQEKAAATYALMIEGAGKATGDWAATAHSASNEAKTLAAKTEDAKVSIGQALQPAMAAIVPLIAKAATAFSDMVAPLQESTVALAAFGAVALTIGGTVGWIVLAVGAVVVALVLLWTQWDEIWGWIKDHPAIAAVIFILSGPIGIMILIVGALKTLWQNWDQIWGWIKQAASDAVDWVRGAWHDIGSFFDGIVAGIKSAFESVYDAITAPFRLAIDAIKGIWNGFVRGWNGIHISIPSVDLGPLGEIGGGSFDLPNLPKLASGGIVKSPTLALVGERGPEAVVPLSGSNALGNNYSITVNVAPGVSPAEVGAATVDAIRQYERVAGKAWRA